MTISIAATCKDKEGNPIVLVGSDTEVILGSERFTDLLMDSKLFRLNNAIVAMSGGGAVAETLKCIQEDKRYLKKVKFNNEADIRQFAKTFFSNYKLLLEQGIATVDETNVGVLVVATPTAIYSVYNDLTVFQHSSFIVSGSGDSVARGAMAVLMKRLKNRGTEDKLRKVLKEAITVACECVLGCGGNPVVLKPGE